MKSINDDFWSEATREIQQAIMNKCSEADMSISDLAKQIGKGNDYLYDIMNDKSTLKIKTFKLVDLVQLCLAVDLDFVELFYFLHKNKRLFTFPVYSEAGELLGHTSELNNKRIDYGVKTGTEIHCIMRTSIICNQHPICSVKEGNTFSICKTAEMINHSYYRIDGYVLKLI